MAHKKVMTKAERAAMNAKRRAKRAEKIQNVRIAEAASSESGEDNFVEWYNLVEAETNRQKQIARNVRKAGSTSPKTISAAREHLTQAFDLMGGVPALVVWGRANATEFYRLWARLIPKESVEVSAQLPLEELLKKLAGKEELSVGEAAFEIGAELLEQGRIQAQIEDGGTAEPGPEDSIN